MAETRPPEVTERVQEHLTEQKIGEDAKASMDEAAEGAAAAEYTEKAKDESVSQPTRDAAITFAAAEEYLELDQADQAMTSALEALDQFSALHDNNAVADALRLINRVFRAKQMPGVALDRAKADLEKFQAQNNKKGQAEMRLSVAEGLLTSGRQHHPEAIEHIKAAASLYEELGDKTLQGSALLQLQRAMMRRGAGLGSPEDLEEVLQVGKDATKLFEDKRDKHGQGRASLSMASVYLVASKLDEAMQSVKAAEALFKEVGDDKLGVAARTLLADAYLAKEWPKYAAETALGTVEICRTKDYKKAEAIAVHAFTQAACSQGDTDKALKVAEEALQRFKDQGSKREEANVRNCLVHIFHERGEPAIAQEHVVEEMKLLQELGDRRRYANAQLVSALLNYRLDEDAEAIEDTTSAISLFKQDDDKRGEGVALHVQAFAQLAKATKSDLETAKSTAQEALDIFQSLEDRRWEAATMLCIAQIHHMSEDKLAATRAQEAVDLYKSAGDVKGQASALMYLALIHFDSDDQSMALSAADEAYDLLKEINHKKGLAAVLHTKSSFLTKKDPEGAIELEQQARTQVRRAGFRKGEAIILQGMQAVHQKRIEEGIRVFEMDQGKMMREANRKAYKASRDAAAMCRRCGDRALLGTALISLARAHVLNGKLKKAHDCQEEALQIFEEIRDKRQEVIAKILLAELQVYDKKLSDATDTLKLAAQEAESLKDVEVSMYALDIEELLHPERQQAVGPAMDMDMMGGFDEMALMGDGFGFSSAGGAVVSAPKLSFQEVRDTVMKLTIEVSGAEEDQVDGDTPLMDTGMDSLSAVQFRNVLLQQFKGISLPSSVMFDYPSINQICDYIVEESGKGAIAA